MGRIRAIKPELLEDQKAQKLDDKTWRLFVSMWLLADDYGALRAHQEYLSCYVFQDVTVDTDKLLQTLEKNGMVTLYQVNGEHYLIINNWDKHQKIQRKGRRRVPEPESLQEVADKKHKIVGNNLTEFSPTNTNTNTNTNTKTPEKLTLVIEEVEYNKAADINEIWKYYLLKKSQKGRPLKLTDKRRGQIKARLKDFSLDEMKLAIDRLFQPDSWWLKNNYTLPQYVFRSTEQVDKLLEQKPAHSSGFPKLMPGRGLRFKPGNLPGMSSEPEPGESSVSQHDSGAERR